LLKLLSNTDMISIIKESNDVLFMEEAIIVIYSRRNLCE